MRKFFFSFIVSFFILSCDNTPEITLKNFPDKWHYEKSTTIVISNLQENQIDHINFYIDSIIKGGAVVNDTIVIPALSHIPLGKHEFIIRFFSNKKFIKEIKKPFTLYAKHPPAKLSFELIQTYPHDINAFTQGLEFDGDTLYESTGLNGASSVRKVNYKTGEIIKKYDFTPEIFAEGLTLWQDSLLVLTWKNGKGFVFDKNSFESIGEFPYHKSKEGWGLCHNEKYIFKSDGTNQLWILDPETLKELRSVPVYAYHHAIKNLNELEWANGLIYTNVWQKNALAVIDPATGQVIGVLDLSSLLKHIKKHPRLDVLNGIAYHQPSGHFFVTGKNWDKIFEIKINWPEVKKENKLPFH